MQINKMSSIFCEKPKTYHFLSESFPVIKNENDIFLGNTSSDLSSGQEQQFFTTAVPESLLTKDEKTGEKQKDEIEQVKTEPITTMSYGDLWNAILQDEKDQLSAFQDDHNGLHIF